MKKQNIIIGCMILVGVISCKKEKATITDQKEYNTYLTSQKNEKAEEITKNLEFWNKRIKDDSLQITALAPVSQEYTRLFKVTGNIAYLKKAEKGLHKLAEIAAVGKSSYLLALARNYISQHRFKDAKRVAQKAYELQTDTKNTEMVLFDVSMELGEYEKAETYLKKIENQNDFNFLIRLAKWNDYKGNLDKTIKNMEKAKFIAERINNDNIKLWSYTNIADYYGHAGDIQKSYNHFLKALAIDPSNAYAKKGIAWIVYSYENNPKEALRILDAVTEKYNSPDYFLLKAEIADYAKNTVTKEVNLKKYLAAIKDIRYGKMYNTYSAVILAEEFQEFEEALSIASNEIIERPTPQSYDLKAYILHLKGENKEALEIAEKFIVNKTFEPEANYHIAEIYKANKMNKKVEPIKQELLESGYELGPVTFEKIQNL